MRQEFLAPEPSPVSGFGGYEHHMFGADGGGRGSSRCGWRRSKGQVQQAARPVQREVFPAAMRGGPAGGGGVKVPVPATANTASIRPRLSPRGPEQFCRSREVHRTRANTTVKPVIRALGVDRASQQVWATIGDMLLRFDRDGNLVDTYRVATRKVPRCSPWEFWWSLIASCWFPIPPGFTNLPVPINCQLPANNPLKPSLRRSNSSCANPGYRDARHFFTPFFRATQSHAASQGHNKNPFVDA